MNVLENFIRTTARKLFEGKDNNLTLYHGSNSQEIFSSIYDNQFFTVNDYIGSNYAYNFGGLMYEVSVDHLFSFELQSYDKHRQPKEYEETVSLLKSLYNDDVANNYERRYFTPSPSSTFDQHGWEPIINWAKENGYDSLKFVDESYDTHVHDICYIIFDGSKAKIQKIYDVTDYFELNKPYVQVG